MSDVKTLIGKLRERKDDLLKTDPTLYCSAMAHLRGKLHMERVRGNTCYELGKYCWSLEAIDERRHIFRWDKTLQEVYVRELLGDLAQEVPCDLEKQAPENVEPAVQPKSKGLVRSLLRI